MFQTAWLHVQHFCLTSRSLSHDDYMAEIMCVNKSYLELPGCPNALFLPCDDCVNVTQGTVRSCTGATFLFLSLTHFHKNIIYVATLGTL